MASAPPQLPEEPTTSEPTSPVPAPSEHPAYNPDNDDPETTPPQLSADRASLAGALSGHLADERGKE